MSGSAIASKVQAGLLRAQGATGPAVAAQVIQKGPAGGTPTNPTPGADVPHDCTAIKTKVRQFDLSADLIEKVDSKYIVASSDLTIEPKASDKFVFGGKTQSIMKVEPLDIAGVVLMYKIYTHGPEAG